jgi:D-glycero-D-manno-heptose 1,7-bisphosphate phosphatase
MTAGKAVFLDRDGTLVEDVPYCAEPARIRVLPGVVESLKLLKVRGFNLIIVTNQSGIGRGYFDEETFWKVQAACEQQLGPGLIDATYFCGDHPDQATARRKPGPGMLFEAARDFELDLSRCFIVGDSESDVEAGLRAGVEAAIRIGSMTGPPQDRVWVADTFAEAATLILATFDDRRGVACDARE